MSPFLYFFNSRSRCSLMVLFLFFNSFFFLSASSLENSSQLLSNQQLVEKSRKLLEMDQDQDQDQEDFLLPKKKSSSNSSIKNQTKLIKPNLSTKNQTKLIKTPFSTKNLTKSSANSTKPLLKNNELKIKKLNSTSLLKKLNSTTSIKKLNSTSKPYNTTKSTSSKKILDLLKSSSPKNKTTKPISSKESLTDSESQKQSKNKNPAQEKKKPNLLDLEMEDDLVSEFRDLPSKFQQSLLPDLERISITSKKYLNKANKEMTKGFKPIVGNKYASTIATIISFFFIIVPLLLVSLIFNRFKAYFSIQKIVIFIQIYLSIYFSILCLSSVITGLEPLRFFYATSQSTYVCIMVLQTLGYVLYLLLLLMYLILVFSTDSGLGSKLLGLAQTFVGFAVGLHFYVAVFHRVVLHQPPKTNWKVHAVYATCFIVICFFAKFDRRKKAYLEEGGEEGKKN